MLKSPLSLLERKQTTPDTWGPGGLHRDRWAQREGSSVRGFFLIFWEILIVRHSFWNCLTFSWTKVICPLLSTPKTNSLVLEDMGERRKIKHSHLNKEVVSFMYFMLYSVYLGRGCICPEDGGKLNIMLHSVLLVVFP